MRDKPHGLSGVPAVQTLHVSAPEPFKTSPHTDSQTSSAHLAEMVLAPEGHVLVLYTGGTIGMVPNAEGALAPAPKNDFQKKLMEFPQLHDPHYVPKSTSKGPNVLCLPKTKEPKRVVYTIKEYDPLLDSSNMTMSDWSVIANDIYNNYEEFDGFVLLHGTDTLSYTSSALSFMLENLGKPVVVTGSQIPIFETRSDGLDNLLGALILAGNYVIPEVMVYFNLKLLRGNRTTKLSSDKYDAFDSPNSNPIAMAGIDIVVDHRNVFRSATMDKFKVHLNLNPEVGIMRIFPSITASALSNFLKPPLKGVILQTYGAGNVPGGRKDIIDILRAAQKNNILVVNTTQCVTGSVASIYDTGKILASLGVVPGSDMTPEAALTKLSYVLSKDEWSIDKKRLMMQVNLRGELTPPVSGVANPDMALLEHMSSVFMTNAPETMAQVRSLYLPSIINHAVKNNDLMLLGHVENMGGEFSMPNYDGRTPLHVACCEGNIEVLKFLLNRGASVHVRDRFDQTPLENAIVFDFHELIKALMKSGAHLRDKDSGKTGGLLTQAAAAGNMKRLQSLRYAGASFSAMDVCGNSALHVAVKRNNVKLVKYLLDENANKGDTDDMGYTPLQIAKMKNFTEIIKMLEM